MRVAVAGLFAFAVLVSVGCETTNYEPLFVKKELKKLSAENDRLKEQVEALKAELAAVKGTSEIGTDKAPLAASDTQLKPQPVVKVDQVALAGELEKLGVYVGG